MAAADHDRGVATGGARGHGRPGRGDPRRGRDRRLPARAPRPRDHRRGDLVPPGRPVAGALAARADAAAVAGGRRGRCDRRGLPGLGGQRGRGGLPGRRAPRGARLPPRPGALRGHEPRCLVAFRAARAAGADRRGDPRVGARGPHRHPAVGRRRRGGRAHTRRAVRAAAARERARRLREPHRRACARRTCATWRPPSRRCCRTSDASAPARGSSRCSSRRRSGRATRSTRRSPPAPTSSAWRGRSSPTPTCRARCWRGARRRSARASPATRTAARSTPCSCARSTRTSAPGATARGPRRRSSCARPQAAPPVAVAWRSSAPARPAWSARPRWRASREVVVFDGRATIGGQLAVAAAAPNRPGCGARCCASTPPRSIAHGDVEVRLGTASADADDSRRLRRGRDRRRAARRSRRRCPASTHALSSWQAIAAGPEALTGRGSVLVVVDDGFGWWPGASAVELGVSAGCAAITVATPAPAFGATLPPEGRVQLLGRLRGAPIAVRTLTALDAVTTGGAVRPTCSPGRPRSSPPTRSSSSASASRATGAPRAGRAGGARDRRRARPAKGRTRVAEGRAAARAIAGRRPRPFVAATA